MTLRKLAIPLLVALAATIPLSAAASPDEESAERGYLGVRMQRVTGGLAEALNLQEDAGVLLGQVIEASPAEEAGLEKGDIVTRIEDAAVTTPSELKREVREHRAGDEITIEYLRDGRSETARVTLGERPRREGWKRKMAKAHDLRIDREHGFLGVMTQPLEGSLGEYFGVENGEGALVTEVVEESPAAELGLQAGDVILEVDGRPVRDPRDLRSIVGEFETETDVEIVWMRDQREERGKTTLEIREGRFPSVMGWHGGRHSFDFEPFRKHVDEGLMYFQGDEFRSEMDEAIEDLRTELDKLRAELEEVRQQQAD